MFQIRNYKNINKYYQLINFKNLFIYYLGIILLFLILYKNIFKSAISLFNKYIEFCKSNSNLIKWNLEVNTIDNSTKNNNHIFDIQQKYELLDKKKKDIYLEKENIDQEKVIINHQKEELNQEIENINLRDQSKYLGYQILLQTMSDYIDNYPNELQFEKFLQIMWPSDHDILIKSKKKIQGFNRDYKNWEDIFNLMIPTY